MCLGGVHISVLSSMSLRSEEFYTPGEYENPKALTQFYVKEDHEEEEVATDGEVDEYN